MPTTGAEMVELVLVDLAARCRRQAEPALVDEEDAVHRWRTTTRRLRSVTRGFGEELAEPAAHRLHQELTVLGALLGASRDLEVRIADLRRIAAEAGVPRAQLSPLLDPLRVSHAAAHARLVEWWQRPENTLEAQLVLWESGVPLRPGAGQEPARMIARRVVRASAQRAVRLAGRVTHGDEERQHALRKACRRLRHLGEAVTRPPSGLLGAKTARLVTAAARLQSVLGEQRDAELLAAEVGTSALRPDDLELLIRGCVTQRDRALAERAVGSQELRAAYHAWR